MEETLERDSWNDAQWSSWLSDRLATVLHRAATRVPYYQRQWAERRRRGDRASWEYLENWPILEKVELREECRSFVAEDCSTYKMFHEHTSGTTGTSLDLWLTRKTLRRWYAMFEARWRRWYGLSRHDRWAILGGQLVTPISQNSPPFWVWNAGMNQLYLSSYHLSPDHIGTYLDALGKYRVKYLYGYPSAIYSLARELRRRPRPDLKLEIVITNAEPLYDFQRELIGAAFDCPVKETYGMSEMVAAASECERANLHQWPDAGIIEAGHRDEKLGAADLICTGLVNSDMPLIRYRVGDRGRLSNKKCDCGRNLPLIESIEGRVDDVLYSSGGRPIGRLDPVFKSDLSIIEAQIIQESLNCFRIRYVPSNTLSEREKERLTDRLRERVGDAEVLLEPVAAIPRTSNGKFRAVMCNLTVKELDHVRRFAD